LCENGIAEVNI